MQFKILSFLSILMCLSTNAESQSSNDSCIQFSSPVSGTILQSPSCTLSVQSTCNRIKNVEFQAQYFISGVDTPIVQSLGSVSNHPFTYVWDTHKIPNQVYTGVEFIAIASMQNGKSIAAKRDRIFFLHNPLKKENAAFPYDYTGTKEITGNNLQFSTKNSSTKINAGLYWNETEVAILLDVSDPRFSTNITRENLASMGMEFLIDTTSNHKCYPDSTILMYVVPLSGKPYQVTYHSSIDENGNSNLSSTIQPCEYQYSVSKEDSKGFSILFTLPLSTFNGAIPDSLTCNIVCKTLDNSNNIVRTSWIQTDHIFEAYCPVLWGKITFDDKPFAKNRLLMFAISFAAGLLFFLLIYFIIKSLHRKPKHHTKIELNEEEKQQFEKIKTIFEEKVIQKDLTIDHIAKELKMPSSKLNSQLKKLAGMSSQNYLMYCRTEIAKERLRSSHWNEAGIAEACGFENVAEMEKYFYKFNKITTQKFRQQQQVS